MELTDPGFDHTVLSEFRVRLLSKGADRLLLDILLARLRDLGLIKQRGRQRTDSTYVLAAAARSSGKRFRWLSVETVFGWIIEYGHQEG